MKSILFSLLLMGIIIIPTGCATSPRGFPPVGIQNFDVVDNKLLRGAQFNHAELSWLTEKFQMPGKPLTVINLRGSDTWADESTVCAQAGVRYINVPLNSVMAPSKADIEKILQVIKDAPGRVFVHCQFGCDRTGTVVACYRIRFQGMPNAAALNDAETHGMATFEIGMKEFIKHFK